MTKMEGATKIAVKYDMLEEERDRLVEIAKKPVIVNNTNYKTVNNVLNMISPELIDYSKASRVLTAALASKGAEAVAEAVYTQLLLDGDGKPKMICRDPARGRYKNKNKDGEIEDDNNLTKFKERIKEAMPLKDLMKDCLEEAELKKVGNESVGLLACTFRDRLRLKDGKTKRFLKSKVNKHYVAQEKKPRSQITFEE